MEIKGVVGNAFGHTAGGALVKFESADSRQLVQATSGLAKALAVAGAIGLGAYLISKAFNRDNFGCCKPGQKRLIQEIDDLCYSGSEFPNYPFIPVTNVCTPNRRFIGVLYEPESTLDITCEGNDLSIPLDRVCWIFHRAGFVGYDEYRQYQLRLIDGSIYKQVKIKSVLNFLSVAGLQKVEFSDTNTEDDRNKLIVGTQVMSIESLKRNLKVAMEAVAKPAIEIIGEEIFTKYFQIKKF